MNSFLYNYQEIFYYLWVVLLIARVITNQFAFDGDPDIDMSGFKPDFPPMILLIFTFFWDVYAEDTPQIRKAKLLANALSKIFIISTVSVIFIWCYLVGLKM